MLKNRCKHLITHSIRMAGSPSWPFLKLLPRIGRFAEALERHHAPFCAPIPPAGTLLNWPAASTPAPPPLQRDDVPPAIILHAKNTNWSGQRVALMAHWDPHGEVAPYVQHYAQKLRDAGFAVILACSDAVVLPDAARSPFDAIVYRTCSGYDFSSWKAAMLALPEIFSAEELLLTNDSVFAPVGDLAPLLSAMATKACDFWGLVESHALAPHLQSFFVLLKKTTLLHPAFQTFWASVGSSPKKRDAIHHEIRLCGWLAQHGLQGAARFPVSVFRPTTLNPSHYAWDSLLRTGEFPFIKRELLFQNPYAIPLTSLRQLLKDMSYPAHLITDYAQQNNLPLSHE